MTAERRLDEAGDTTSDDDEALADETAEECFGGEDNARKTAGLISSFVSSWERHKHDTAPAEWLANEFRKYPNLWEGEEEMVATAKEVVANVERRNADQASLHAHVDAGKSKASWLAGKIEEGAAAAGASSVGAYATKIEHGLDAVNEEMRDAVRTKSFTFNQNRNLDGLIAEQHHAATFNLDAVAKGSPLRAKVLGSTKKNSVDIVIQDGDKIVRRYQSKYGKDANATQSQFADGDYRGQGKLVADGQEDAIANATNVIEAQDVRSKPLSKAEAKRLQERAQQEQEARQYEWNDVNRIEIAKGIGKQAAANAAMVCVFQGARILGRRVWNSLRGKENQSASEDLREFFESSIKGATHVGVQTAVSGAVVVAVKNGLIKSLQNTPVGHIVNVVHVGMENAKVFWKFAKGDLTVEETLDAVGTTTASAIGGLAGVAKGIALGSAMGPVGSFVGGIVGGIAGSKIGEAVWIGSKAIIKAAAKAVASALEGTVQMVKSGLRTSNPLNWAV